MDLIERQAAIDLLKQMRKDGDMVPWEGKDVFARIRKLPSAQPQRMTGRWVEFGYPWFKCSQCGAVREKGVFLENYCPNCGSYNGGEE